MMKKGLLFFVFLFLVNASQSQDQVIRNRFNKKEMHVFILMGQSNMAGYAEMLPRDTSAVKDVFLIPTVSNKGYCWRPASHPLHNRLPSDRFGLGLFFAKAYLKKHPNVIIGLIPVAWGGAPIDQIDKGTATYSDAISKAIFAVNDGVVKGVLWHQGESDTVTEELALSYEKKLHRLIEDLRQDLNIPNLPFVVGNLAEFYGTGKDHNSPERVLQIGLVKKALQTLPQKVNNTGYVSSKNCRSIDKHMVHFDRKSYIILGKRYAAVYNNLLQK